MQRGQLSLILSFTQSHNFAASLDAPVSPAVFACDANGEGGGEVRVECRGGCRYGSRFASFPLLFPVNIFCLKIKTV